MSTSPVLARKRQKLDSLIADIARLEAQRQIGRFPAGGSSTPVPDGKPSFLFHAKPVFLFSRLPRVGLILFDCPLCHVVNIDFTSFSTGGPLTCLMAGGSCGI